MKTSKIIFWSITDALFTAFYSAGVAWFLFNGEKFFGKANSFLMPTAMLLIFVISAAITGLLVLGKPVYLYLNGSKNEAVKLLFYTIGWLIIIVIIVLGGLAILK